MITRWLFAALLCLAGLAHADGIDDATVYVPIQVQAAEVDEAVPVFRISASLLPAEFWAALAAVPDTACGTCRFTNSDGTVEYPIYVPDTFDDSGETGAIFVRGTGMSASVDVDYRLYAGSPTASMYATSATNGRDDVFDGYAAVYGLTGTHQLADWTGVNGDLTAQNSPTAGVALGIEGMTGYGVVAASTQYLYLNAAPVASAPITLLSFFEVNDVDTLYAVAAVGNSGSTDNNYVGLESRGDLSFNRMGGRVRGGGGSVSDPTSSSSITANTVVMGTVSRDVIGTGTSTVSHNGTSAGTNGATLNSFSSTPDRFAIGAQLGSSAIRASDGTVGFTLVDNAVLSTNYQATLYRALTSATFYDVGAAVELGGSCTSGSTGWVLFQTAAQSSSSAKDWNNISDALVDDANTADIELDDSVDIESEYLNFTNPAYGTTIPTGAGSYTVEFRIKRRGDTTAGQEINDLSVHFIDDTGTRVGDNKADTALQWPSTAATKDYTVTGVTFDGTEFTSAAGLALRATAVSSNGAATAEVYAVWAKIDWDCGDVDTTAGFFELAR